MLFYLQTCTNQYFPSRLYESVYTIILYYVDLGKNFDSKFKLNVRLVSDNIL